tara:strand:+ start:820 stop:1446 length:627 start_codon:yes stop_codon:yes gene_type:complete
MKKLILIAAALFAITTVSAQDIIFGAKAGVNLANVDAGEVDTDVVSSFHIGITAEFEISDTFSIQPELVYSLQGTSIITEARPLKLEVLYKTNFINLPIMAKYYVSEGISLEAGPQIGFLINAEVETDITNSTDSSENISITIDSKDNYKSIDFGFNVGVGYKLESGLNFTLRYNLGLSNLSDTGNENVTNDSEWKNRVLQLSVGYTF